MSKAKLIELLQNAHAGERAAAIAYLGHSRSVRAFFNFGWYMSMYGAGKLERGNIIEYEVAAQYAIGAGCPQFVDALLHMAEVEWDHELYFRTKCTTSRWMNYVPVWSLPPPRTQIREKAHRIDAPQVVY